MMFKFLLTTLSLASISLANDKIVSRGTYDYVVDIVNQSGLPCIGSLIAKDTIITPGHCINGTKPESYRIRGKIPYYFDDGEKLKATKIILHPNYDKRSLDNNIALVKIDPNHSINPFLKLNNHYTIPIKTKLFAIGWGINKQRGISNTLKALDVEVIDSSICSNKIGPLNPSRNFCATSTELGPQTTTRPGSLICLRNGGYPVVAEDLRTIVGVLSGVGKDCSKPSFAFTNVFSYSEWIRKNTNFDSQQTSKPSFENEDDKSNPSPNVQYPLGRCNKAGDRICFQKDRIGVCKDNESAYSWSCPKDTTCKFDDGKARCAR